VCAKDQQFLYLIRLLNLNININSAILCFCQFQTKDRHDSSSSDSGITITKPSDISPPESPYQKYVGHIVFADVEADFV
jgi:hypothetical protein